MAPALTIPHVLGLPDSSSPGPESPSKIDSGGLVITESSPLLEEPGDLRAAAISQAAADAAAEIHFDEPLLELLADGRS